MSMGAYLKIVEGALLAAWTAGQGPREALMAKDDGELTDDERKTRTAWDLVREIVLRVPNEREAMGGDGRTEVRLVRSVQILGEV